ncbi:YbaK/EbsC family protein [Anaerosalibacter massiliensis]|uniref:YbaK/EbsC family protein n=1 Tax=Anaerosalibacter massiliensis TaxID=1347392 RepID=A0A9X2MH86_9FIRM|nr:YbaK/EbsC family protein [Anaerosalibacter massiliensis]MCR2045097.1 YbaK/EbsC family protein [Anaerosalibacter massiliensis]
MSMKDVRKFFKEKEMDVEILTFEDTSTVPKAAKSLGVSHGEIAKTLLFKVKDDYVLIVMAGDTRLNNRKFKNHFKSKAKMAGVDEVMEITGHPIGGVCPFGLKKSIPIYLDNSLKKYAKVFPAAGSNNSSVEIKVEELQELTDGEWVDLSEE